MDTIPTIAEAARLIAAKELSPVELTKDCIARMEAYDDTLHAFILPTEERALADARAAETRVMAGDTKGPLDGIPIGHKDIYCTAGIRTTGHSRLLEHNVPAQDATSVRKWAEAGVVLMGKLSTHEFAMGGPSFDLPWPPARNPWNPEHFTAGSSSGTGAAVASGMILGGTGSDTGGSIRGPAALCGIAGIKPTYGLVSRVGVLPLSFSMDHAGPMAWTVEDCALLLQAMAGHDPTDPASADRPVADFTSDIGKGVKGMRIGVVRHFFESDNPVSPATLAGINHALDVFEHLGAEISDVKLSPLADYSACGWVIIPLVG
jgi:aspartyl-tRNA(Asn)/glutamyl-tRNA(Gln) amidotransferase subunit A